MPPLPDETHLPNDPTLAARFRDVLKAYEARRASLLRSVEALRSRSGGVSNLRLVTILLAVGLGIATGAGVLPRAGAYAAGAVFVAFIGLVITHAVLITKEAALDQRIALVDRALGRLAGRPGPDAATEGRSAPPDHPYAKDLDIFGKASLFERLDTTETDPGESILAGWLSSPSPPTAVAERHEAVKELMGIGDFREDLAVEGLSAGTKGRPVGPLIAWAEGPRVLVPRRDAGATGGAQTSSKRPLLVAAAALVPITLLLFTLSQTLGAERLGLASRAWVVTLALQIAVLVLLRASIEPLLAAAASKQAPFGRYRGLFGALEARRFTSPRLSSLGDAVRGSSGADASSAMRSLETIIGYADLRHNGLVHILADVFLLWDVWCALALDRWRAQAGERVRAWFEALGEIEALSALATYAYERPDHTFPEIEPGGPRFEAKGLGHPLIPGARRVSNDASLPGSGTAMLVTGSNMSGKSTFLRSIGINAVLAQAGAPVCAASLRMSPLAVRTSMRIDDSLEHGISHFYAELERLKSIVDAANAGHPVLFLLDEILHGTNSRERHIGGKAVVLHLIDRGAIGAVSSHDLALADIAERSDGRIRNVHFEEIIKDGRMGFDYMLKPGVVTTTNALRLMRLVGLDVPGLSESQGPSPP